MDYHIERGIRFSTDIEFKSLYDWALQEVAEDGKVIDRDQIPWRWTLYFSGTDIRHSHSVEAHGDGSGSKASETIKIALTPSDRQGHLTQFSMFGTARKIDVITLTVKRSDKDTPPQTCKLWGIVSYTSDDDFRRATEPDILGFDLELADEHFDDLRQAAISDGDYSILFSVSDVAGFYADWSPDIYTDQVKVLTGYGEQQVELPPELSSVPRLGKVGHYELTAARRALLSERGSRLQDEDSKPVRELTDSQRREVCRLIVQQHLNGLTDPAEMSACVGSLLHRLTVEMVDAASTYAATTGASVENLVDELAPEAIEIVRRLQLALSGNKTSPSSTISNNRRWNNYNFWEHAAVPQNHVRIEATPYMERLEIEGTATQYLELPYRSQVFDRVLVDVLIALEMYGYMDECFGIKAKAMLEFNPSNPSLLITPHPFWGYIKFVGLTGGILIGLAALSVQYLNQFIGVTAASWLLVGSTTLFVLILLLATMYLFGGISSEAARKRQINGLIRAMLATYQELASDGTVSAIRVREVVADASKMGVAWPSSLFAVLDDSISRAGRLRPASI